MQLHCTPIFHQVNKKARLTLSLAALALTFLVQCDFGLLKDEAEEGEPPSYKMGGSFDSLFFNAAKQSSEFTFYPPLWGQKWDDRMVFTVEGEKDQLNGKTLEATFELEGKTITLPFEINTDTVFSTPKSLNSQSMGSGAETAESRVWFQAISPSIRSFISKDLEINTALHKTNTTLTLRLLAKDPDKPDRNDRAVKAQAQYHVDLNLGYFVVAFRPNQVGMSIYLESSYQDDSSAERSFTKITVQKIEYLTDSTLEIEKCANRAIVRIHYSIQNGYSDTSTLSPNHGIKISEILFDTAQSNPVFGDLCQSETDIVLLKYWDGIESPYTYPIGLSFSKTHAFGMDRIIRKSYMSTLGGYSGSTTEMEGVGRTVGKWSSWVHIESKSLSSGLQIAQS